MRNSLLVACLLLLLPCFALAQDAPKAEIFGGYSFLRADEEDSPETDLHGWNASVNVNLNKWFGVKGDFSGHYNDFQISPGVKADLNTHLFLGGVQFTSYKYEKVTPFVHALLGVGRRGFSVSRAVAGTSQNSIHDHAFALVLGGGIDVKFKKSLAWRAAQVDYVFTTFDDLRDDRQHNLRLSTGLVLRLGDQ
ncbi:MAG: outer membrane beta-barrel protein [Acidobacteria bacterium]|nr:outer membrane beta-barrel protein [Acidobacteriota bacterium]